MILVLKGADFSADNIGTINLERNLDANVISMMSHITRFPAEKSNEYAQALNTLYLSLVAEGLYSKLKLLAIPFYSSTIEEAGYNLKADISYHGNFPNSYELNANNEAVIQHNKELRNNNSGAYKFAATPSNKISFFGIMNPNGDTQGHFISAGIDFFYTTNQFVKNKIQRETYFQVFENGAAVIPAGGSGAFGGSMLMPNGAFVASYDDGDFHYMDGTLSVPKEGTSAASNIVDITVLAPSIVYFPMTLGENLSYKLIGAGSNLSSQETYKLYQILAKFNELIS